MRYSVAAPPLAPPLVPPPARLWAGRDARWRPRTVWQLDTNAWLRGDVDLGTGALPRPSTSSQACRTSPSSAPGTAPMRPAAYEAWFVETARLLCALPRDKVAIFYQTPGRDTGGTAQPGSSTIGSGEEEEEEEEARG